jgi:hypothetical protein
MAGGRGGPRRPQLFHSPGLIVSTVPLALAILSVPSRPAQTFAALPKQGAPNDCSAFGVKAKACEDSDSTSYCWRDDRCEGVVGEPHGANNGLTVVSFVRELPPARPSDSSPPKPKSRLLLRWPTTGQELVHLTVHNISGALNYRMDFAGTAGEYLWPQDVVTRVFKDGARDGLTYLAEGPDGRYRPIGIQRGSAAEQYLLVFRSDRAIRNVDVIISHETDPSGCAPRFRPAGRPSQFSVGTHTISIDPKSLPCAGAYQMEIRGLDDLGKPERDSQGVLRPARLVLKVKFLHDPEP